MANTRGLCDARPTGATGWPLAEGWPTADTRSPLAEGSPISPRTVQFLVFNAFCALSLIAGYAARKRGWLREDASRAVHLHTVAWAWPIAALLGLWRMPVSWTNLWLVPIELVLVAVPAVAMIPVAKWIGCDRRQVGVMATAAGLGNLGFTLGGYICYSMLEPPDEALAFAVASVMLMAAFGIFLLYPLARHYGSVDGARRESTPRMVLRNFYDLRSLQFHGSLLGVALAVAAVPYPRAFAEYHVIDMFFYVGGFLGYFGIGLRLRLGDSAKFIRQHAALAVFKFAVIPLLSLLCLALVRATPWPLPAVAQQVVLVEAFMPTAIFTVMIANLFHLDGRLASVLFLWNSVAFVVLVLPVMVWVI